MPYVGKKPADIIATAIDTTTGDFSGAVTVTTADNNAQLTLTSTDADAAVGPVLEFNRNSASAADSDLLGRLSFIGKNDAGENVDYGIIRYKIDDASDGTEDADIAIRRMVAGTSTNVLNFKATETIFNEDSVDLDFRVESNGNTHAIMVQGGSDCVGIKTASPNDYYADDFVVTADNQGGITIVGGTSDTGQYLAFADGTSGSNRFRGYLQYAHDTNSMILATDGAEQVRIHSNGVLSASDGIALGVGTANTASNVISDYEEGTWTPQLTDLSNNATMHSLNGGVYTKIGRVVTVTANVRTTSLGSVSGNLYLTGFPFASANTNGNHGAGSVANAENLNITAGHAISIYYSKNGSQARFDIYDSTGGVTPLQGSEWSSDGQAAIQITYSTA